MARYKNRKTKQAPVIKDQKNKNPSVLADGDAGDKKKLFNKNNTADSHQELKKSGDPIKNLQAGNPDQLNAKDLKKGKIRLNDFSMLKSAIEKKNALPEKRASDNNSSEKSLSDKNLSEKRLSEKAGSQVEDAKSHQKKIVGKNSDLESKNFSVEQKGTGSGANKTYALQKSWSEADEAELFRTAVERISNQEIHEKIASSEGSQPKKGSSQAKPSSGKPMQIKIDLHGLTVDQARLAIDEMMRALELTGGVFQITIVTGKGLHSEAGPVLASEIHRYVEERFGSRIISLESSPMETIVGGIPLRGNFKVMVRL